MEILELFKRQLAATSGESSKSTIKNYVSDVRHFIGWAEATTKVAFEPSKVTPEVIQLYEKTLGANVEDGNLNLRTQLSVVSMKRHLSSLRKFFTVLKSAQVISENPFQQIVPETNTEPTDYWHLKSFKDYLLGQRASKITVKNYVSDIQGFARWYEEAILPGVEKPLSSTKGFYLITQGVIQDYRKRLLEIQNAAPRTINRKLSALRRYLDFATKKGFITAHELTLDPVKIYNENLLSREEPQIKLADIPVVLPTKITYSKIPPIRLFQKLIVFPYLFAEEKIANVIASFIAGKPIDGMQKLPKKLAKELSVKNILRAQNQSISSIIDVKNVGKEFYAPDKISLLGIPIYKRVLHHARFTRPNWYKRYHNYSFVHYVHFALLVIFASGVGVALYQNLVAQKQPQASAAATAPPRILSFQGRLTDNLDNPITSPQAMRFMIYNNLSSSGSAELWEENRTVAPDQDGIFSVLLGADSNGADATSCGSFPPGSPYNTACLIPSTVFTDNSQIWLGVSVGSTSELTPRQKIASVGYATNSEFLQGQPPTTQAGITSFKNVILALDSSGNLTLTDSTATDHTFQANNGMLKLSGQPLYLTTNSGSAGNVVISPDGLGKIDVQHALINTTNLGNLVPGGVEVNDKFGVLATESAVAAFVVNNNTTGGDILTASSSGTSRLTIQNDGTLVSGKYTGNTGAVLFTNGTAGVIAQSNAGADGQCLNFTGGVPSWGGCGGTGYWNLVGGALTPINDTVDLLVGGQTTASAKFRFINVNSGIPTASISANLGNNATFLTGNGTLSTTNRQTLTIGNSSTYNSTGDLLINPNGIGKIGIGTTTPLIGFDLRGNSGTTAAASISANTSFSTLIIDNSGTGDLLTASSAGIPNFTVKNNGDVVVGQGGNGKLTVGIVDPYLVQNQKTTGTQSLTLQTMGATNADIIFKNQNTILGTLTQIGQLQLPVTGSTGGLVLGGDAQIFRGAPDRFDLASGDSLNLVLGSLLFGGSTVIDSSRNGTFVNMTITGTCTGCISAINSPFQISSGAIVPLISSVDFLLGAQSTDSAKFAVLNMIGSNAPTASVSAQNVAGQALVLASNGSIQSSRKNSLTLGGNTTGNITIQGNGILSIADPTVSLTGASPAISTTGSNTFTLNNGSTGNIQFFSSSNTLSSAGALTIAGNATINGTTVQIGNGSASTIQTTSNQNLTITAGSGTINLNTVSNGAVTTGTGLTTLAGNLTVSGATTTFNNAAPILTTGTNTDFTLTPNGTGNLILTSDMDSGIKIGSSANTTAPLSISGGIGSNASLIVNQLNSGDIFAASSSGGLTRFVIANNGNITDTSASTVNFSGAALTVASCIGCGGITATNSPFQVLSGAIVPNNISEDFLLGATSTASAKFAVLNMNTGVPVASVAGILSLGSAAGTTRTIGATNMNNLQVGDIQTGGISLAPAGTTAIYAKTGGNVGIGTTTPTALLHVNGGNNGANAAFIVNQTGAITNDILAASSSGTTKFVINNNGTASSSAGFTIDGVGNIQSTKAQTLTIGGSTTGNIVIDSGSGKVSFNNNDIRLVSGTTLTTGGTFHIATGSDTDISGVFKPNIDNSYSLGSSTLGWSGLYTYGVTSPLAANLYLQSAGTKIDVFSPLDLNSNLITNIGNAGTDFTSGGGLTLASTLTLTGLTNCALAVNGSSQVGCGAAASSPFTTNLGAIFPINTTMDFLFGSQATVSAKFAVLNMNTGTPVASVAGTLSLGSATGTIRTIGATAMNALQLGDTQTGDLILAPANAAAMTLKTGGSVGIGTTTPASELHVTRPLSFGATGKALAIFDQIENQDIFTASYSGTTKFTITNAGGIGLGTSVGTSLQCLLGGTTASWGPCSSGIGYLSPFRESNGSIFALNSTEDLLLGAQSSASAAFRVTGQGNPFAGTLAAASVSASTSFAGLVVDNRGIGDLFTASASGGTRFTIANNGNITDTSASTVNFSGAALTVASCIGCGGITATNSPFQVLSGAIVPNNISEDFLLGATSTASAKFAVLNMNTGVPVASVAGTLSLGSAGGTTRTIGATAMNALQLGDAQTGDLILAPANAAAMTLKTGGSVGVGTTAPAYRLDVQRDTGLTNGEHAIFSITDNTASDRGLRLGYQADGASVTSGFIRSTNGVALRLATSGTINKAGGGATITDGGNFGVGTYTPISSLHVTRPLPLGANGTALAIFDQIENQDILTASSSGITKFTIANNGNITDTSATAVNFSGALLTVASCTGCGGVTPINAPFQVLSGTIVPINSTEDFLIGAQATTSAKFAVLNISGLNGAVPTASVSSGLNGTGAFFDANGNFQTVKNQTLTIGGNSTGNINLTPTNGIGQVSITSDLSKGARNVAALNILQANDGSNDSTGNLLNISNLDAGSTTPTVNINQSAAGDAMSIASAGRGIYISGITSSNSIELGTGINTGNGFYMPSTSLTGGTGIALSGSVTSSGLNAFTGSMLLINPSRTYNGTGSVNDSGVYLNIARSIAINNASGTFTVSGDLARLTSTCSETAGSCIDTGSILSLTQSFGKASGAVLNINNSGLGTGINLVSNSGGQAAVTINKTGVGDIFTASASGVTKFVLTNNGNASASAGFTIDSAGSLQTTKNQTLTIGGNSTGDILLKPGNISIPALYLASNGNVGHGINTPTSALYVTHPLSFGANGKALGIFDQIENQDILTASAGGITRFTINNVGAIGLTSGYGISTQCLTSNGSGAAASWGTCVSGSTSPFEVNLGAIVPGNTTEDLLIGSRATSSAKFAVLNMVGSGSPTASVSSGLNGNGTYMTADGTLATTTRQTLSIGNSATYNTTGNILMNSNGTGNVGIGTTNPSTYKLLVQGTTNTNILGVTDGSSTLGIFAKTGDAIPVRIGSVSNDALGFFTNNGSSQMVLLTNGNVGVGTNTPASELHVTRPLSYGATGKALAVFDQLENQDILTASYSGTTKFAISKDGNLALLSGSTVDTIGTAGSLNFGTGTNTSTVNIGKSGGSLNFPGTVNFTALTANTNSVLVLGLSGVTTAITTNTVGQCLISNSTPGTPTWGGCGVSPTNSPFQVVLGTIVPLNSTQDFLLGAQATSSAKFAVLNVNSNSPVASISAQNASGQALVLGSDGSIQSTRNNTLTLGGGTTGDITIQGNGILSLADATINLTGTTPTFRTLGNNNLTISAGTGIINLNTVSNGNVTAGTGTFTIGSGGTGTLALNGSALTTTTTTMGLFDTNATIINFGRAASSAINMGGTSGTLTLGNGGDYSLTTSSNGSLTLTGAGSGEITLASDFNSGVNVGLSSNTPAPLSISGGIGSNASLIVNQLNSGDIFAASASGLTKFVIANNGNISDTAATAVNFSNATLTVASCTGCSLGAVPPFEVISGMITPRQATEDFAVGGTSTASAKFAILNMNTGTPVASMSANNGGGALFLTGNGTISTRNRQSLNIGGIDSGQLALSSMGNVILQSSGSANIYVGSNAGNGGFNTGTDNSFFGFEAGLSNTSGSFNVFLGDSAGFGNQDGISNVFVGVQAGGTNTSGNYNAFVGNFAGAQSATGNSNAFFGDSAGFNNLASNNTFIGYFSGNSNTTGTGNLFMGYYAAETSTPNTTGSNNTFLGFQSGPGAGHLTNASAIGALSTANCFNCLILGSVAGYNTATVSASIGIGTTNPLAALQVISSLGTSPVASFSGITSAPALLVNQEGNGDLLVASYASTLLNAKPITGFRLYQSQAINGYDITMDVGNLAGGKINAAIVDPPYTIDGKGYATYMPSMIGVNEEYSGTTVLSYNSALGGYAAKLDFNNFESQSDAWVYNRIIDPDISKVRVLLTPNSQAKTWYKKDGSNRTITLYADRPVEISYRLSAPRFDAARNKTFTGIAMGLNAPPPTTTGTGTNDNNISVDPYFATLTINQENGQWILKDSNHNAINQIDAFSKAIVAVVQAGYIGAQQIVTNSITATQATFSNITVSVSSLGNASASTLSVAANSITIGGQDLRQFIIDTVANAGFSNTNLISPLAQTNEVKTNVISPLADNSAPSLNFRDSKFNIQDSAASKTVAWFDTQGNASFSGQITANNVQTSSASVSGNLAANSIQTTDASVSGTLRAGNIIANNISGLDDKLATLAAAINNQQSSISTASPSANPQISILNSQLIAADTVHANFGIFEQGITSMGPVTSNIITATDQLAVGQTFTISNNAINTVGTDLAIQSLRQGNIVFEGGLIRIDTDGNMSINGNLNVLGEINSVHGIFSGTLTTPALVTDLISPVASDSDISLSLKNSQFSIRNSQFATTSAVLSVDNKGNLNASGSGTFAKLNFNLVGKAEATSLTEAIATGSAGFATLRLGQPELTIKNANVTSKSLIYITPFGDTGGQVLYLLRQTPQSEVEDGSFTVGLSGMPPTKDMQFNWLIVN